MGGQKGLDGLRLRLRLFLAFSERRFSVIGYLDPLRVWRGVAVLVVVPVPPLVRRAPRVPRRRVLPSLLAAERRVIQVAPGGPHCLVATPVAAEDGISTDDIEKAAGGSLKEYLRAAIINTSE